MEVKNDFISRQAAIEALLEKGQSSRRYKIGEIWELNFDEIREVLNSLPSVEPVRHRKWEETVNSHCTCPVCGAEWSFFENETERFKCCPNCGERLDD